MTWATLWAGCNEEQTRLSNHKCSFRVTMQQTQENSHHIWNLSSIGQWDGVIKLKKIKQLVWSGKRKSSLKAEKISRRNYYQAPLWEFSCSGSSGRCEDGASIARMEIIKHPPWGRGNVSVMHFCSVGPEIVMSHHQLHTPWGSCCLLPPSAPSRSSHRNKSVRPESLSC